MIEHSDVHARRLQSRDAFTSGEASGEKKGATKKAKQNALKMLQSGKLNDEDIINFSGLTQTELDELKRQLKK